MNVLDTESQWELKEICSVSKCLGGITISLGYEHKMIISQTILNKGIPPPC